LEENSPEFLGKMIFINFFHGKFDFFTTFLGENFPEFSPEFSPKFSPEKLYKKSACCISIQYIYKHITMSFVQVWSKNTFFAVYSKKFHKFPISLKSGI
jgi:hypothetical protein